jgi:translation initiation factor IF-1
LAPQARNRIVRLIAGDRVLVELAAEDPTRGRIVSRA